MEKCGTAISRGIYCIKRLSEDNKESIRFKTQM